MVHGLQGRDEPQASRKLEQGSMATVGARICAIVQGPLNLPDVAFMQGGAQVVFGFHSPILAWTGGCVVKILRVAWHGWTLLCRRKARSLPGKAPLIAARSRSPGRAARSGHAIAIPGAASSAHLCLAGVGRYTRCTIFHEYRSAACQGPRRQTMPSKRPLTKTSLRATPTTTLQA